MEGSAGVNLEGVIALLALVGEEPGSGDRDGVGVRVDEAVVRLFLQEPGVEEDLAWEFLFEPHAPVEGMGLVKSGIISLETSEERRSDRSDAVRGEVGVGAKTCESPRKVFQLCVLVVEAHACRDLGARCKT